jgi:hypothetical protein
MKKGSTFILVCVVVLFAPFLSSANNEQLPAGWRRLRVGSVSFYVPPHLRRTGSPGNRGVVSTFAGRDNDPYVYYAYGRHVPCTDDGLERPEHVTINGKKAQLEFRIRSDEELMSNKKDWHTLDLCVPDVGDRKNKFEIYATSLDVDILNAMSRSFAHIRFR